jgi:hypothetical protein
MLVLTHEEDLPWGENFIPKVNGPQKKYYTHFNRDYEEYCKHNPEKKHYFEYNELKPIFIEMITTIVNKYKNDPRVFAWNLYNEPGITIGERAIAILEEMFNLVREINPTQPLTADVWRGVDEFGVPLTKEEQYALEQSDFISFHSYNRFDTFTKRILAIKNNNPRPIFLTEWLNRVNHNDVFDVYPFLKENNIASYVWGFVNGDTFTDEPWNQLWEEVKDLDEYNYDFTKWQHNLFRKNHKPYDPSEIKLIIKINNLS